MRKRFLSFMLILALLFGICPVVSAVDAELPFTDVQTSAWYYDGISYVYENGLMNGVSEKQFAPHAYLTRSMVVTILGRMEGIPASGYSGNSFRDVTEGNWYYNSVEWAAENQLVQGYGSQTFGPNDPVTREQLAVILARYLTWKEKVLPEDNTADTFQDAAQISTWSKNSVAQLCAIGLLSGSNGYFCPSSNATRAQAAKLFASAASYLRGVHPQNKPWDGHSRPDAKPQEETTAPDGWYDYTPEEDAVRYIDNELYVDISDGDHIQFDEESGLTYFDNELILFVTEGTTEAQVEAALRKHAGIVVGKDGYVSSYLVRFPLQMTMTELNAMMETCSGISFVTDVFVNQAISATVSSLTTPISDIWPAKEWNFDSPSGGNWGLEAIHAPEAWAYYDHMEPVRVGVFDGGFYAAHEDLDDNIFASALAETAQDRIDHGTHVSGIIAAEFDSKGVCGVSPTAKLAMIDCDEAENSTETSDFFYSTAYSYLIGKHNCRVVNMSLGERVLGFAASHGNTAAKKQLNTWGRYLEKTLCELLEQKHDFTICVSAGNTNGYMFYESSEADYGYFVECTSDHPHEEGVAYYENNAGKCTPCTQELLDAKKWGNTYAYWNSPIAILEAEMLEQRIIVVGSCALNKKGQYVHSSFSNIGARVDVVAPGDFDSSAGIAIESTTQSNNGYSRKRGTSMASPHVAGIAALLYAVNPELSGVEVKAIIKKTANQDVSGCAYKMVNAAEAVKAAIFKKIDEALTLEGSVVSSENLPLKDVSVRIKRQDGTLLGEGKTDANGAFSISQIYTKASNISSLHLELEKAGYATVLINGISMAIGGTNHTYDIGSYTMTALPPEDLEDGSSYVGDWEIDAAQTMEANGVDMTTIFGSAYSEYGSSMAIMEDHAFSYRIAAGIGGAGVWNYQNGKISYSITAYEAGGAESGTLTPEQTDAGEERLIMEYLQYRIYWKRSNSESGSDTASGFSISGTVLDTDTKEGVPNAEITVYDWTTDSSLSTRTDSSGTFRINLNVYQPDEPTTISIQKDGYDSKSYLPSSYISSSDDGSVHITGSIFYLSKTTSTSICIDGDGTKENPYRIATARQLANLASHVNAGESFAGKYFIVVDTIDLSIFPSWTPIGTNENRFQGNFDGNYFQHAIHGLQITESSGTYWGLFGYVHNAWIQYVNLDVNIALKTGQAIGGIAGAAYESTISNCMVSGSVSVESPVNSLMCGGIAGIISGNSMIAYCSNYAQIDCAGSTQIGGIVGNSWATQNSTIQILGCTNYGMITGSESTGEIAGSYGAYSGSSIVID